MNYKINVTITDIEGGVLIDRLYGFDSFEEMASKMEKNILQICNDAADAKLDSFLDISESKGRPISELEASTPI